MKYIKHLTHLVPSSSIILTVFVTLLLTFMTSPVQPAQASGHLSQMNHQDMALCSFQCITTSKRERTETNNIATRKLLTEKEQVLPDNSSVVILQNHQSIDPLSNTSFWIDKIPIYLQTSSFLS